MTRRYFFGAAFAAAPAALVACRSAGAPPSPSDGPAGWARVAGILERIRLPDIPERTFDLAAYGAPTADAGDAAESIRQAIRAAHAAGGGRVRVPEGAYRTGPIHLLSNVGLHLEEGATLRFDPDPARYLPLVRTRWEGVELLNYSPLIYAYGQENIAVTGAGTLDGGADCAHWWPWKGRAECGWRSGDPQQQAARDRLFAQGEAGAPLAARRYGEGAYLRPAFIQPYACRNVLIEGVRIVNSPMWEINPVRCRSVTVRGVHVSSHGPNNDGCDPESCADVLIEDCTFDCGDDCIALKSGRNADGRRLAAPIQDVVIRNCRMMDGHGGVTIGSEISGGARRIYVERCTMDSPNLDRGLRIKTNSVRGGVIEDVYLRDITIGAVAESVISVDFTYEEGDAGAFPPTVRRIEVERLRSGKSRYAALLRGYARAPIAEVRLADCAFGGVEKAAIVEHVRRLQLENVTVNGHAVDSLSGI